MRFLIVIFLLATLIANAQWVQLGEHIIGSNSTVAGQGYMTSLSSDGKTLLTVGYNGNNFHGLAWIFTFDGNAFVQVGNALQIADPPGYTTEITGGDLSADGNTVVLSSWTKSGYNVIYGGACVFTFNGTDFVQAGDPLIVTGTVGPYYGINYVNISGNGKVMILGGERDDNGLGAAWIFSFNGSNFVQTDKLVGTGHISQSWQGATVDISEDGTTAIVGAYYDNNPGNTVGVGAAWVYTLNGAHFVQMGNKLTSTTEIAEQGRAVAISGDGKIALVGAPSEGYNGAVFVYTFDGFQFVNAAKLTVPFPLFSDNIGSSVDITTDGKTIIIGSVIDSLRYCVLTAKFDGSNYVQDSRIIIKEPSAHGAFVSSVNISDNGKTAIIGSGSANNGDGIVWAFGPCTKPTITGITGTISVCESSRAVLSVTAIGSPLNFQWYQDGIFIPGAINPTLTFGTSLASAGNYTCVVSNECRTVSSAGIDLVIYPLPTITGNIIPGPVCLGDPVTITGAGAPTLSVTGGITFGKGFVPTISGIYTLTGIDANQCSNKGLAIVTIISPLSLTISGNNSICPGTSAYLTVSGANTYVWNNGVSAAANIFTPSISTTYQITGTGSNQCPGYQAKASVTVTVTSIVSIPISGKTLVCAGDSAYLSVGNVSNIKWFNNATTTSIALVPESLTPVSFTAITDQGCKGQGSVIVISDNIPSINISGNTSFCPGSRASLTATGATKYHWSNGADNQSIQVAPDVVTKYSVTGISGNGCSNMATVTVTLANLPAVSLDLSSLGYLCDTLQRKKLTGGTPENGSYYYLGTKVDELNISKAGSYSISYQYFDHQCTNTASGILIVNHCTVPGICERPNPPCQCTKTCPPPFKIYSGITPNGDLINDTWVIDSLPSENKVVILDKWGNEIYKTNNYSNDWNGRNHEGKELPAGVYYYILEIIPKKETLWNDFNNQVRRVII